MRYPENLKKNGTIGFAAPSMGCATEPYRSAFDHAQEVFRSQGHSLVLGPNCYADSGIGISNSPKACGQELEEMYCSREADVIISCGGGELMCEILDFIDFDKIRAARPKWYLGYSDNTNFTFLLTTLCDVASVYGPCAGAFGMEPWHPAIRDAYQLLLGEKRNFQGYDLWEKEGLKDEEHPLAPYHVTEPSVIRWFLDGKEQTGQPVQIQGRLLGGCMDCLVNLLGTGYDQVPRFAQKYQEDGIVWFLESCDLNVMAIRRAVWQMKHAGWFSHVKGFLIGRPLCHGQEIMGLDQYHAVCDLLAEYQVPVIMDVDLGHLPPMIPMVCGGLADVSLENGKLNIAYRETF